MSVGFHRLKGLFWLVALSFGPGILFAGELTGIRLASGPLSTRIVLDLENSAQHRLFALENPHRVVIDLPGTAASSALRLPLPKGKVRSVRTGSRPGGELRVVLDLGAPANPKSFLLEPEGGHGYRLVIDLTDPGPESAPTRILPDRSVDDEFVVAIDAGHGGKDAGASGNGVREKDVVLQIARRLAALINEQRGIRAVLIRDGDRFVELNERVRLAHEAQADLFVSIHADSSKSKSVSGAAVYSIDMGRAVSETAKRLADRENAADLVGGVRIAELEDDVARIVLDLSRDTTFIKSLAAGEAVIDRLSQVTTLRKSKVEPGRFVVLTSPDIPSLLVETAFISNPREAENLSSVAFQNSFAHALYAGIIDYAKAAVPTDSYLARNPPPIDLGPIRHVIARGETLSEIAERYRISLSELRRSNSLKGDVIRVGQVLTIPTRT